MELESMAVVIDGGGCAVAEGAFGVEGTSGGADESGGGGGFAVFAGDGVGLCSIV
jgi:hypothetical protein